MGARVHMQLEPYPQEGSAGNSQELPRELTLAPGATQEK